MGARFSDITLYTETPHHTGTPEHREDRYIQNYISDLYMQKMHGYKPPKTTRITIQPAYHEIWNRTWKTGSIVAIAPYFSYPEYAALDKKGKYRYILDLIQRATIPLSEEYGWDKSVFETAYKEVLEADFRFRIEYPPKQSRDRKKTASLIVEKTETTTSVSICININGEKIERKLFEKPNTFWYDCVYFLSGFSKWLNTDKFGIFFRNGMIECWYSIEEDKVSLFASGKAVQEIKFRNYFTF